ncbi:electron transfer flavoprotein alpha and beta-subunit [Mycolicibacterium rhodesiae JS60]|nr:electron transfer flavoprotein alpha and beta-subunit [Mycolicibacterium rhodesiae JS60]
MKYRLKRAVTTAECHWLPKDLEVGETVQDFHGATYGCISTSGIAVSFDGANPFFEVPRDALSVVPD